MSIRSTIPAAAARLATYMQTVADANPTLDPKVYVSGWPTASVANNFLMVGAADDTAAVVNPTTYSWAAIPGTAMLRTESYSLMGTIRTSGGTGGTQAALARLGDAYTLLNGLMEQIVGDVGGSGDLTPSGSWGDLTVSMIHNGPVQNSGWSVVLGIELQVINAQIQG